MIKYVLLYFVGLIGFASCSSENNLDNKLQGWWQVQRDFDKVEINTLEWNIIKSNRLYFSGEKIEFINGIEYAPSRHFGFFTPYRLHGDTLLIFYEPESEFLSLRVEIYNNDSINLFNDLLSIKLKRLYFNNVIDTININDIQTVELSVEFDTLANQDNLIDYKVEVNLINRQVELKYKDGVSAKKQITPFEVTHLLQQVSRIDLTNRQYDSEVSYEPANYVIKIRTLNNEILLELGDNINTPDFIKGLVNYLDYLGMAK